MGTSRLPGFYKMRMAERLRRIAEQLELDGDELHGDWIVRTVDGWPGVPGMRNGHRAGCSVAV